MNEYATVTLSIAADTFPMARKISDADTYLVGYAGDQTDISDEERLNLLYDAIKINLNEVGITSIYHFRDDVMFYRNDTYYVWIQLCQYMYPSEIAKRDYAIPEIRNAVKAFVDGAIDFNLRDFFELLLEIPNIRGGLDIPYPNLLEDVLDSVGWHIELDQSGFTTYMNALLAMLPVSRKIIHHQVGSGEVLSNIQSMYKQLRDMAGYTEMVFHRENAFVSQVMQLINQTPSLDVIKTCENTTMYLYEPRSTDVNACLAATLWFIASRVNEPYSQQRVYNGVTAFLARMSSDGLNEFNAVARILKQPILELTLKFNKVEPS